MKYLEMLERIRVVDGQIADVDNQVRTERRKMMGSSPTNLLEAMNIYAQYVLLLSICENDRKLYQDKRKKLMSALRNNHKVFVQDCEITTLRTWVKRNAVQATFVVRNGQGKQFSVTRHLHYQNGDYYGMPLLGPFSGRDYVSFGKIAQ